MSGFRTYKPLSFRTKFAVMLSKILVSEKILMYFLHSILYIIIFTAVNNIRQEIEFDAKMCMKCLER